ncbi:MAG TPA: ATP:cob(I)alamin adenosyltransferase, partial [Nitrospirales bacterium]|nr:ATP:cob(I)alamin adenosyltransferase [Nitrospirales bacterium]
SGERVGKDSLRVDTYGSLDELNSFFGCSKIPLSKRKSKRDSVFAPKSTL